MTALNNAIDALDNRIAGKLQLQLFADVQTLLLDRIVWFLRNGSLHSGLTQVVRRFGDGIAAVDGALETALPDAAVAQLSQDTYDLVKQGVPEELARRLVALPHLSDAPDIVLVASGAKVAIADAARVYFKVAELFALGEITTAAKALPVTGYYERLALDRAISSLAASNRKIAARALKAGGLDGWMQAYGPVVERSRAAMRDIASGSDLTVAKLSVAAGLLADLAEA
jgi:glutamate dehydrogenase